MVDSILARRSLSRFLSNTMSNNTLAVAVIASSGGGTATLGHTDPPAFLQILQTELTSIQAEITHALYIALDSAKGMDTANEQTDTATLYQVDRMIGSDTFNCRVYGKGTLFQVNEYCRLVQKTMAQDILRNQIHGLVCISCHVGIFSDTLQAAAIKHIPVTGSGGTTLSQAVQRFGVELTGNAGGSVATTSYTRAVSYTYAFASYWKRTYQPWLKSSFQNRPTFKSILTSCLPAFWGVCMTKALLQAMLTFGLFKDMDSIEFVINILERQALPTACAATACYSSQPHTPLSSLGMATVIASTVCTQSILSGIVAGLLAFHWSERLLYWCIFHDIPATMTNILTAGGVGGFIALLLLFVTPILRELTVWIRWMILFTVSFPDGNLRALAGFFWGCLLCYGSKVGWYHAIHLPLILVEMELGDTSFLGAVDELTLVLVCAGICAGNLVRYKLVRDNSISGSDVALCRRGLLVNISCGDFVEVCYPYMESNRLINVGGYLASGLSCAWLVASASTPDHVPKSSAYLPLPVAIALAGDQRYRMLMAGCIALGVSFVATITSSIYAAAKRSFITPTPSPAAAIANKTNGAPRSEATTAQAPRVSVSPTEMATRSTVAQRPLKVGSAAKARGPYSTPGSHRNVSAPNSRKKSVAPRDNTAVRLTTQWKGSESKKMGRWTDEEHSLFLEGLARYGKDYRMIGRLISTRTMTQIRSHAQSYFRSNKSEELAVSTAAPKQILPSQTKPGNGFLLLDAAAALDAEDQRGVRNNWTEEEHRTFLQGLDRYGEDYVKITRLIGTRSLAQVLSHGQQYFESRGRDELARSRDPSKAHVSGNKRKADSMEL